MKLSSISLIAAALAAIVGSVAAAPTFRPFERDVDIYSRANHQELKSLRDAAHHARKHGLHTDAEHYDKAAERLEAALHNQLAGQFARGMGTHWHPRAQFHEDLAKKVSATHWQDPDFFKDVKNEAYKTLHAGAAELNTKAAWIAQKNGFTILHDFHEHIAARNTKFKDGDKQDPRFAEVSIAAAKHTLASPVCNNLT